MFSTSPMEDAHYQASKWEVPLKMSFHSSLGILAAPRGGCAVSSDCPVRPDIPLPRHLAMLRSIKKENGKNEAKLTS